MQVTIEKANHDVLREEQLERRQPIDDYVKILLAYAKGKYGLPIDIENPTREERLQAAVVLHKDTRLNAPYAVEVMAGQKLEDGKEPLSSLGFCLMHFHSPMWGPPTEQDLRNFYMQFDHQYWPDAASN